MSYTDPYKKSRSSRLSCRARLYIGRGWVPYRKYMHQSISVTQIICLPQSGWHCPAHHPVAGPWSLWALESLGPCLLGSSLLPWENPRSFSPGDWMHECPLQLRFLFGGRPERLDIANLFEQEIKGWVATCSESYTCQLTEQKNNSASHENRKWTHNSRICLTVVFWVGMNISV